MKHSLGQSADYAASIKLGNYCICSDYHGDFKCIIVALLQITKQDKTMGSTDGSLMVGHEMAKLHAEALSGDTVWELSFV
jgi:hypothetical protein